MRLSLVQTLESAHEDSIWTAAWSLKEDVLVTGSVDESVKLWQAGGPALEQQHQLVRFGEGGRRRRARESVAASEHGHKEVLLFYVAPQLPCIRAV